MNELDSNRICAQCDYDLRGSGEAGLCPECGTPFDGGSRIWRKQRHSRHFVVWGTFFLVAMGMQCVSAYRSYGLASAVPFAALVLMTCFVLMRREPDRARRFVGVSPEWLVTKDRFRTAIRWKDMFSIMRMRQRLIIHMMGNSAPLLIDRSFVGADAMEPIYQEILRRAPHIRVCVPPGGGSPRKAEGSPS